MVSEEEKVAAVKAEIVDSFLESRWNRGIRGIEGALGPDPGIYGMKSSDERKRERRERIATAVLAGFAADPYAGDGKKEANVAVAWADALIKELDK